MITRRIVLAHSSRLLQEMLKRVFDRTDGLQVVQEQIGLNDIDGTISRSHPDWLIISPEQPPGVIQSLVARHPSVKIITLSAEGSPILIQHKNNTNENLDGLSLSELLTILRDQKEVV